MRRTALYLLMAVFVVSISLAGQECRDPTPQEKAVAEKVANTLKAKIIAPLEANSWQIDSEESALTTLVIASHPGPPRPLMTCGRIFEVKLVINPSSERGQAFQKRLQAFANPSTMDEIKKMTAAMAEGQLAIRANENDPYLRDERHEEITRVNVPGVPVSYRTAKASEATETTTLCYGNWKPEVTFGPANKYILFPFTHKAGTPYIENMCVKIDATPQVTEEVLKLGKWSELNSALTP